MLAFFCKRNFIKLLVYHKLIDSMNFVKNCVSYNYYCCITGYFRNCTTFKTVNTISQIPVSQKSGYLAGCPLDSGCSKAIILLTIKASLKGCSHHQAQLAEDLLSSLLSLGSWWPVPHWLLLRDCCHLDFCRAAYNTAADLPQSKGR